MSSATLHVVQDPAEPSLRFDTEATMRQSDEAPTARPDGAPEALQARPSAAPPIRRLAIVIRDDAFDRLLTPLTFAWEMGRKGVEVDILFVLWSVRLLTTDGVCESRMDPRYAHREDWLKQQLQRDGDPLEIHDFFKLLASTGHVRLHGCRLAAMTFDVAEEDLLPEAAGIMDPGVFLREIAARADHCQYF
jgi:peroxiredoxin family protein